MDFNKGYKFSELIYKELLDILSEKEREEFDNIKSNEADLYEKIVREVASSGEYALYNSIDYKSSQAKMEDRIRQDRRSNLRVICSTIAKVAAVLVLAIGVLWHIYSVEEVEQIASVSERIQPGIPKASLILANGTIISLDEFHRDTISRQAGAVVLNSGKEVNYSVDKNNASLASNTEQFIYNTLDVPRGGEYRLTLADGTKVWLNSQTKIRFPVKFKGNERKVYLEGEAYFKVAHDKTKPFRVETKGQTIEVLGTCFNVSSYEESDKIYTTLEEGKVKVSSGGKQSIKLNPGEQSIFCLKDKNIIKRQVDVNRYIAWKNGKFVLEEQTLERILDKMSRWYDINVFYMNSEAKEIVFKGSVQRYGEFNDILKILEKTGGVNFRIKGNTVIVSKDN